MIWHGRTSPDRAAAYVAFLQEAAIPDYRGVPGIVGSVGRFEHRQQASRQRLPAGDREPSAERLADEAVDFFRLGLVALNHAESRLRHELADCPMKIGDSMKTMRRMAHQ